MFATDRTDRVTYIAQGWRVTDPQALADIDSRQRDLDRDSGRRTEDVHPSVPGGGALSRIIEPGPEFGRLFHTFEHTAFRLETRDQYKADIETDALRQFVAGEDVDLSWFQDWPSMIEQSTRQGRQFRRVRVVSVPLTDYSRFGIYCSQYTNAAGEDIRYLARDKATDLPRHDYWLFDSRKLVRMLFDEDETFLGGELIEDAASIVAHNYWRDAAWHKAVRRDDFAAE